MELPELPIDWRQIKLPGAGYSVVSPVERSSSSDKTLDDLIHANTRILRTKLEVLTAVVQERLKVRRQNIDRIASDQDKVTEIIGRISAAANYHLREHKEKGGLYKAVFELTRERRDQDTECWRDIVLVLRDFLTFWDYYERAKARGAFLENV
jgi:hypothetical protein